MWGINSVLRERIESLENDYSHCDETQTIMGYYSSIIQD